MFVLLIFLRSNDCQSYEHYLDHDDGLECRPLSLSVPNLSHNYELLNQPSVLGSESQQNTRA